MMPVPVLLVAGARPNFMKVAPIYKALRLSREFAVTLVHTGQHYDENLSDVFLRDLDLPQPEVALHVGSGSHGTQTARVLERFEKVLLERQPGLVIVVGDVNSTLACALATAKILYSSGYRAKLAHVEAGLRSFDRSMPEEVNRVLTDTLCDFLFTTEQSADENLLREGIPAERIFFVGNVMIDTLLGQVDRARGRRVWQAFGLEERGYALLTLHRPSNVDNRKGLEDLIDTLRAVAGRTPIVFPAHPRTIARFRDFQLDAAVRGVPDLLITEPLGYLDFLGLMSGARLVMTDSGGIQEETTVLGIPCLTLRTNTERPVTVTEGTSTLVGNDRKKLIEAVTAILSGDRVPARQPPLWDGKAAQRIVAVLASAFNEAGEGARTPSSRPPGT